MDDQEIAYIIANRKFKQSGFGIFFSVLRIFFNLMIGAIMIYAGWSVLLIFWIPIFYFFIIRLRQNTRFKEVATQLPKQENYKIALAVLPGLRKQKMIVQQFTDYIFCTVSASAFLGGSEITIVPLDNSILINSRPLTSGNISIMRDVINVRNFEEAVMSNTA